MPPLSYQYAPTINRLHPPTCPPLWPAAAPHRTDEQNHQRASVVWQQWATDLATNWPPAAHHLYASWEYIVHIMKFLPWFPGGTSGVSRDILDGYICSNHLVQFQWNILSCCRENSRIGDAVIYRTLQLCCHSS